VFEAARKGLGLDSLDVSTGASGGPAVGASRYINDRISVGVKAGAKPADTGREGDGLGAYQRVTIPTLRRRRPRCGRRCQPRRSA
jgi:hypothetical protein